MSAKKLAVKKQVKKASSSKVKTVSNNQRGLLFVIFFALIGVAFLMRSFAASDSLPANAQDIVAAYIDNKPTQIEQSEDGSKLTYNSYSASYLVLKDGTLICDNGNSEGTVSTGKIGLGQVRQLHKELGDLDLGTLPNYISASNDPNEAHVGEFDGYVRGDKAGATGIAVFKDAPKPDKLVKAQAKILKACEKADKKSNRGTTKYNEPTFGASSAKSVSDSILAVLSPKVSAAPSSPTATVNYDAGNYQFNRTNQYRAQNGKPAYAREGCLDQVAWLQAKRMAEQKKLYHNPNLANEINYVCKSPRWTLLGENVGVAAQGNNEQLFMAYVNSPSHRKNLLDTFNRAGSGTYYTSDGRMWHAQVFGRW